MTRGFALRASTGAVMPMRSEVGNPPRITLWHNETFFEILPPSLQKVSGVA